VSTKTNDVNRVYTRHVHTRIRGYKLYIPKSLRAYNRTTKAAAVVRAYVFRNRLSIVAAEHVCIRIINARNIRGSARAFIKR